MNNENHNALNSIARKCNEEMKKAGRDNLKALAAITNRYADTIKLLGFTKLDLLHEIGIINGRFEDRRNG